MILLLAIALMVPAMQDDASLAEWIRKLDDDSAETRDAATAALTKFGKEAIPALQRAQQKGSAEAKERLADVIRRIEKAQKLARMLPPASRVTLKGEAIPLREALEKFQKQVPTPLDFSGIPADETVTLSLTDEPFWDALDALCRASGRMMYRLQEDKIVLRREKYAPLPRHVSGPLILLIDELRITYTGVAGTIQSTLMVGWERGVDAAEVRIASFSILGERGNDLSPDGGVRNGRALLPMSPAAPGRLSQPMSTISTRVPAWNDTKFSRVKIEAHFDFILEYDRATFNELKNESTQNASGFSVTFKQSERSAESMDIDLEISDQTGASRHFDAHLLDKAGKKYAGNRTSVISSVRNQQAMKTTYRYRFPVPEKVDLGSLTIQIPKETHTERLTLDVKDLSLE